MTSVSLILTACIVVASSAWAEGRASGSAAELTPDGKKLADQWSALMRELEREIIAELPDIGGDARLDYREAHKAVMDAGDALAAARQNIKRIEEAEGLVNHARRHWISNAVKKIAKAKKNIRASRTSGERVAAEKELIKWRRNKQDGLDALRKRQSLFSEARTKQAEYRQQLADAEQALVRAQADMAAVINGMGLESTLNSDELDAELARYVVLKQATPERLARFGQTGKDNRELIERMLRNDKLLVRMAAADGAKDGNYGRAMQIHRDIRNASGRAGKGHLGRLALAVALEHATPIKQRNAEADTKAPTHVDPLQRYLHYEKAYLAGELDPGFKDLSVWEYRFVVNGREPDEILKWGRDMLRNYRPDHIKNADERWRYVQLVKSEIRWGSQDCVHDRDDLQFTQNILMNGGICGRRAVFGRFVLRAFGVPTTARPQKGHASLVRRTSRGWKPCLGGNWGTGWTKTPYKDDLNFLAACRARATGESFMRVMRAHWIGEVKGESRTWGLVGGKPEFWNGIALYTQREMNRKNRSGTTDDETTEAEAPAEESVITDEDRRITVGNGGVITVPAVATSHPAQSNEKIIFMKSRLGGTRMHYSRDGNAQNFEYRFDAPAEGRYALAAKVVTPSWQQSLVLAVNGDEEVRIDLPNTVGMWESTIPVTIELKAGDNVLTFSHASDGYPKGFTIREFTLTPMKNDDNQ